jgi:hypothetical protein
VSQQSEERTHFISTQQLHTQPQKNPERKGRLIHGKKKYCDNVLTTDAVVDPGGRDEGGSEASVGTVKSAIGAGSSTCEKNAKTFFTVKTLVITVHSSV